MFDSTSFQKSPKVISSIKTKKELQSFYHYSKIVKLKETNQKPIQQSLNYTISQNNSVGVRQSDHISNFEYFINQNSRQNRHRQLKNHYHSQSALSKNSKDKTNWLKHLENQKRIEQSLNKQKFNHSLEHKEQTITRRRILRLSSETSVQSKFDLPQSRPTSKLAQHLQNETLVASIHKKSSVKEISTQNHSQADQMEFENYEDNNEPEEQEEQEEEEEEQELEEKQEFQNTIKDVKSQIKLKTQQQIIQPDPEKEPEQVNKIKKQATIQLHQTKKKLKQQINSQINHQTSSSQQTLQTQQSQLMQTQKTIDNQESNRKGFNNEAYIKQILNEQLKYKQAQQQEEQIQQERLQKIKEIENEIERKKNKQEDFQYKPEQDLSEEAFIKQQQLLKQQISQKEEEERQLKLIQEEEKRKQQKQNDENRMKELEETKKSEIAGIIKKQKTMLEETEKSDSVLEMKKSEAKVQKQKTVFFHQQSMFAQRKLSQEEIESSHREFQRQIDESIKQQKEEEERLELEQLDFVDFMLRAKDIYEVDYEKFKIYSSKKFKKIKEPPKNLDDDDENIYFSLKRWKQINKLGSITIFGEQQQEILQVVKDN